MNKLLLGAAAFGALIGNPAFAQDSADFTVRGTVNAACYANADGTVSFGTIGIDSTTGRLTANQSASSAQQTVWCNGINSTLTFSGTSVTTTKTTSDTDFTSTLTFTPQVNIDGAGFASGAKIGAIYGPMVVTAANLSDGGKLPVAGDYGGTVTVTLTPTV